MRAIVVDDSRAMRTIMRKMLGEIGFDEILEAEHGQAALDTMRGGEPPDVALVDWNMPTMDGLELVTRIRAERCWDRVRVMMVTSETSPRQVYEALKAGADEYAMKPVTRDMIEAKLEMLGVAVA